MFLEPLVIFLLVRYMRKLLGTFTGMTELNKALTILLYAVPALFVIQQVLSSGHVTVWIWHLLLVAIIAAAFKLPEFTPVRPILIALLPLISLTIITDLLKAINYNLYLKAKTYFGIAFPIAITWMIAMLLRSRKQQRALDKERKKTREEEQRSKFISEQKAELELLVAERTSELTNQKNELQQTLTELKSTQTQLIQSEKMASLGELTAGIAHEIQNPLNFVNNFSEVNGELIDEMKNELGAGNTSEAMAIAEHIRDNQQKITQHGKRADAIVKGMLQHSRKSTGQKELTDINALADEYFRLSYHGLRAKDKTFNAVLQTDFDESIGKVNVVPQDIGRVLLNLFTNAFYAVSQKNALILRQAEDNPGSTGPKYEPTVSVSTKKLNDEPGNYGSGNDHPDNYPIEIRIKDNGIGIPKKVLDKIYQPFFSTKPTGQGTGLGLSLSYDIIKTHGGEIKVETEEGKFAEFTVILPVT